MLNGDVKSRLKQENTQLVHRWKDGTSLKCLKPLPPPAPSTSLIVLCRAHRVNELEEQLKDQETRAEQNVKEGLRRHREAYSKMERDKNTQIELLSSR